MYIIFLEKKKVWFSCFDVHFIYKKNKSCDFIFLTTSPLQNIALLFGLRFVLLIIVCVFKNEFRIDLFIYLIVLT